VGSIDMRDILQISRLSNSIDDIEFVANTIQKYRGRKNMRATISDNSNN
jgi:hypothetical protein